MRRRRAPPIDRALRELDRAAELLPNSAEVPPTAAFIYKRQARFRERIAALRRAEALDPRNRRVLAYFINTLRWVRDWPEACTYSPDMPRHAGGGGKLHVHLGASE